MSGLRKSQSGANCDTNSEVFNGPETEEFAADCQPGENSEIGGDMSSSNYAHDSSSGPNNDGQLRTRS